MREERQETDVFFAVAEVGEFSLTVSREQVWSTLLGGGFSQPFHRGEAALSVSRQGGSAHADFPGARGAVAEAPFPSLLVLLDVLLLFSAISFIPKNVLYEPLIFDM